MDEFLNHLCLLEIQIQENKNDNLIENSNIHEFSKRMDICSKSISEESTKFCLAYSNETSNNIIRPLIARLKSATDSFVSAFLSTPKYFGKYSKLFFEETTLSVLKNLKELIHSLKNSDGFHKHSLGNLWSQVDHFISVKKTNQNIVLIKLNESNKLLTDAILELHNEMQECSTVDNENPINDIDDFTANWNADEIIIVNSVYGILKTLQATCVKLEKVITLFDEFDNTDKSKVISEINTDIVEDNYQNLNHCSGIIDANINKEIGSQNCYVINCFDEICAYIISFSKHVDEVISNLYAPIDKNALHQQVKHLRNLINELLCKSRFFNFMNQEDIDRIDFLERALKHNFDKFITCIGTHETLIQ